MRDNAFRLLLVDDDPYVLSHLKRVFRNTDYIVYSAENGKRAIESIEKHDIDAAVIDMMMPDVGGIELLTMIKKENKKIEVIILTGYGAVDKAVEAIKSGASDFIEKPVENDLLLAHIANLAEKKQLEKENEILREQMDFSLGFEQLIGNSDPMLELKKKIRQVGPADASVLIEGETGTGKELIARALHKNSTRGKNSFIAVDCASINENMIESELFGHLRGAYTGAVDSSSGLLRAADTGSLFFDEIGELPFGMQAKLLRSIQQREVRPVGGTRIYPVDIRIIAATNRDLFSDSKNGKFREDLYYRLNVVNLKAPPLRERDSDLPLLTNYFLKKFSVSEETIVIDDKGMDLLSRYDWPGNVRELENIVRRMIAFTNGGIVSNELLRRELTLKTGDDVDSYGQSAAGKIDYSIAANERNAIILALDKCGGKRSAAAKLLGISEATLYRKLEKYSLKVLREHQL